MLRDDGTVFLNLGDSYFGGGRGGNPKDSPHQKQRTNRGSVGMPVSVRRAVPRDTSGKELADSQENGCLCESLCDACRVAYQIGKSHNGGLLAPTPTLSPSESTLGHTESSSSRPPTSGSLTPATHNAIATPGHGSFSSHAGEQPPASLESTPSESSQQPQEDSPQSGQPSGCLLCGRSLPDSSLESVHRTVCTCGTETPLGASSPGTSGMFSLDLAYRHCTTTSLKPKDLIGIPWRVAFALQADGWYLRQDIIWHKPNPMPESVTDRCTKAHEYIFLLSKDKKYYYDHEAIKEPAVHAGKADSYTVVPTRNKRSVWTVTTKGFKGCHFATFPPDLIEPCILAGCPEGGTVLDPFGGSGTTGMVANRFGRNAVLCELNPEYAEIARQRTKQEPRLF